MNAQHLRTLVGLLGVLNTRYRLAQRSLVISIHRGSSNFLHNHTGIGLSQWGSIIRTIKLSLFIVAVEEDYILVLLILFVLFNWLSLWMNFVMARELGDRRKGRNLFFIFDQLSLSHFLFLSQILTAQIHLHII
jgi:hypothetical protein